MLIIPQTCVQVLPLGCINKMYLNNLENIMNPLNHVYFPHHEYVVGVATLSKCVSLLELNAWKDE